MRYLRATAALALAVPACASGHDLPPVELGQSIDPGEPRSYELWTHCGAEWLGPFNGTDWRASSAPDVLDWVPEEWKAHVDEQQNVEVRIEFVGDERLDVRPVDAHPSSSIIYVSSADERPSCY